MNAPEKLPLLSSSDLANARGQALALFPLESLQNLDVESALRCQMILGHGGTFGPWETPESMVPHMSNSGRRLNLRKLIASQLPKESVTSAALDVLLDEGVLWLTRLGLLMRMGPAGIGGRAKLKSMDASTIAAELGHYLPKLVARGATRRLERTGNSSRGFFSA